MEKPTPPTPQAKPALKSLARHADITVLRLNQLFSTSSGVDASLSTICYGIVFLRSQLSRILQRQNERLALAVADKAFKAVLPAETLLTTFVPPVTRLSQTVAGLKAFEDLVADYRVFVRLWGLLAIYDAAREHFRNPPVDLALRILAPLRITADVIFQTSENLAYLINKGVIRSKSWQDRETGLWLWSNRFWMTSCFLEVLRVLRLRQCHIRSHAAGREDHSQELITQWSDGLWINGGWLPLTWHWSWEQETFGDGWVGLIGLIPSVTSLRAAWRETV